jgi:endo-1,4-beta-D-glucanase Y
MSFSRFSSQESQPFSPPSPPQRTDDFLNPHIITTQCLSAEDVQKANIARLLVLVKEERFKDLFGSLNTPSLKPSYLFGSVFKLLYKEIEEKDEILAILRERNVVFNPSTTIAPLISIYTRVGDTNKAEALQKMVENKEIRKIDIYHSLMNDWGNDIGRVSKLFPSSHSKARFIHLLFFDRCLSKEDKAKCTYIQFND